MADIEYMPTLEDIAAACDRIQCTWTDEERQRRKRVSPCGLPRVEYDQVRRDAHIAVGVKLASKRERLNSK